MKPRGDCELRIADCGLDSVVAAAGRILFRPSARAAMIVLAWRSGYSSSRIQVLGGSRTLPRSICAVSRATRCWVLRVGNWFLRQATGPPPAAWAVGTVYPL